MATASTRRLVITCAVTLCSASAFAAPITIDLSTIADSSGNNYSTNYYASSPAASTWVHAGTGLVVQGFSRPSGNANAWTTNGAYLFIRTQPGDRGVGVCHQQETADCGVGVGGGGQANELDNGNGYDELIRLTLPTGYRWIGFGLSSLDDNGGNGVTPERGQLWRSMSGTPGLVSGTGIGDATPYQIGFSPGNPLEPTFAAPAGFQTSPYLFFEAFDWGSTGSRDNDYLLLTITIEQNDVPPLPPLNEAPEPGTLGLLGAGLVALRQWRRRSR